MSTDKTPGQAAYEAFIAEMTIEEQANYMVWEDLPESRQTAWDSAALAVKAHDYNQGVEDALEASGFDETSGAYERIRALKKEV